MSRWTPEQSALLLDGIENSVSVTELIERVSRETGRTQLSVERRLKKIGYLRRCGGGFSRKQGFAR